MLKMPIKIMETLCFHNHKIWFDANVLVFSDTGFIPLKSFTKTLGVLPWISLVFIPLLSTQCYKVHFRNHISDCLKYENISLRHLHFHWCFRNSDNIKCSYENELFFTLSFWNVLPKNWNNSNCKGKQRFKVIKTFEKLRKI